MSETSRFSSKRLAEWLADLLTCLRFCTRVPIPLLDFEKPQQEVSIAASAPMLPIAGALIGAAAAIVLWLAARLGLPPSLAALAAVTALILLTGALHEDGLADFADAMGGATREQKLAIMKDSRIGTFGGLALVIGVLARVMSLSFLAEQSIGLAATVLIAAAASSRCLALLPLYLLPAAREDGLGAAAAHPSARALAIAGIAAFLIGLVPLLAGASFGRVLAAQIISTAAAYGVTVIARRQLQGQTGDIAGTAQQIVELTTYLGFAAQR